MLKSRTLVAGRAIVALDARGGRDDRVGGDALRQPHIAADPAAVADHGVAAEDRRVRVDDDVVPDRRMALGASHALLHAEGAEGHALVELHARAEHGRLADDDAGAVVDREGLPDARAGVDVDAGVAVGDLGQDARDERHAGPVKLMRDAVHRGGEEAGVGEDHLVDRLRGGIAVEDRLGVEQQRRADRRQLGEQVVDDRVGVRAVGSGQAQGVDEQPAQRGELFGDVARAPPDLRREVREEQLEHTMHEDLGEFVQPRRQRVVLSLAGEQVRERGGSIALAGKGHHA